MSALRLIATYSLRIVEREWRRFVLPLLSLSITSMVLMLILLLTGASGQLLQDQARELLGGDVVLESATPIPSTDIVNAAGITPVATTSKLSFSGTLQSNDTTAPFSVQVVDDAYPLYGELILREGTYAGLEEGELIVDEAGLERLNIQVGDTVQFGKVSLQVAAVVLAEPTSLFSGFRFLPTAYMSEASFAAADVDPALLRAEYSYSLQVPSLTTDTVQSLRALEGAYPEVDIDIAGQDQQGLQFGLETVSDFLVIAVLITAVLAAVNVYASILYLVTIERKSLAVLLALGLTKAKLVYILGAALGYIVVLATLVGVGVGTAVFAYIDAAVASAYFIQFPQPSVLLYGGITGMLVLLISAMSFVPAVRKSLEQSPKEILIHGNSPSTSRRSRWSLILITLSTLAPLIALAGFLLGSIVQALLVIGGIALVYLVVAGLYSLVLGRAYALRRRMSFFFRSIVSQKYADGLFGVVSFSSLFVALVALCTLTLLQVSLERFLANDLGESIPSTYVLDVQASQRDELISAYPDIELFSNIRARIIAIDNVLIQEELEAGNPDIGRELGREFNLTARTELLQSETVTQGTWSNGRQGEISVDEDFAQQANIELGSTVVFLIQGFEVRGTVTSLRSTDSRSGLPFFYFVLSPDDIGMFPSVYFGYAFYEPEQQAALGRFLANTMPNVSLIETQSLGPLVMQIVDTLLALVLIVTIPPLLIATLLIAMLVVSSYASRRREGARFRAIGLTRREGFWQYIAETLSLTLIAATCAYGLGVLVAALISREFLLLDSVVLVDVELLAGLALIISFIMGIALYLYKSDSMPLRELLSYE